MPFSLTHSFRNKHTKLAKFLVPILTPLTLTDYTIKDLFSFAEEVSSFDCAHYMTSFDIESLFTNIPLEETINICVDKLFENNTKDDCMFLSCYVHFSE